MDYRNSEFLKTVVEAKLPKETREYKALWLEWGKQIPYSEDNKPNLDSEQKIADWFLSSYYRSFDRVGQYKTKVKNLRAKALELAKENSWYFRDLPF